MRKSCSIQQGKKYNCWSEQSPKNRMFRFFEEPPTNENLMAKPENDSPSENTHKIKQFSTKFNDLGVIITRKICFIQQGEKR